MTTHAKIIFSRVCDFRNKNKSPCEKCYRVTVVREIRRGQFYPFGLWVSGKLVARSVVWVQICGAVAHVNVCKVIFCGVLYGLFTVSNDLYKWMFVSFFLYRCEIEFDLKRI